MQKTNFSAHDDMWRFENCLHGPWSQKKIYKFLGIIFECDSRAKNQHRFTK